MNEQEKKVAESMLKTIQLLTDNANASAIAWLEAYERLCAAAWQRVQAEDMSV
jgi:hypothetical protein